MTSDIVTVTREDGYALIQLNRPDVLNAISVQLMTDLVTALEESDADETVRCMILTGNERAFAAGADIREMAEASAVEMLTRDQFARWDRIRRISKPIIAAVGGFALGGGCELAMACDMIIAAETARFGQPEITIGVIPGAGGTQRLTRAVGKAKAMEMVLTGRMITADEALRWGLDQQGRSRGIAPGRGPLMGVGDRLAPSPGNPPCKGSSPQVVRHDDRRRAGVRTEEFLPPVCERRPERGDAGVPREKEATVEGTVTGSTREPYQTLLEAKDGGVLTLTLNREKSYNALNDAMKKELGTALREASRDPAVRCVVLRGAGEKAFCSGQDLKEHQGTGRSLRESLERSYNPLIRRMREMEKPIIGMINGVAAGAGLSIALACDMRIMSSRAVLIEVFARIGLVPDSGSHWFLPRLVGMARAFEYAATARDIPAEEAGRVGLVNRVVPPEQLEAATMELAHALAAGPTRAIGLIKRTLNRALVTDLGSLLDYEAMIQEIASSTNDHAEGVAAFTEKRKAAFTGT